MYNPYNERVNWDKLNTHFVYYILPEDFSRSLLVSKAEGRVSTYDITLSSSPNLISEWIVIKTLKMIYTLDHDQTINLFFFFKHINLTYNPGVLS